MFADWAPWLNHEQQLHSRSRISIKFQSFFPCSTLSSIDGVLLHRWPFYPLLSNRPSARPVSRVLFGGDVPPDWVYIGRKQKSLGVWKNCPEFTTAWVSTAQCVKRHHRICEVKKTTLLVFLVICHWRHVSTACISRTFLYPLVNIQKLLKMAIGIVDLPMNNGDFP